MNPGQRRAAFVPRRVLLEGNLDHEALDQAHLPRRMQAETVAEVVGAIERHTRPDARGRARRRPVVDVVGREGCESSEVSAGRATGNGNEIGISAVLRDVFAHPRQRRVDIDDLVRPCRHSPDPVVDADAHPSLRGHVRHQRSRFEPAVTRDPSAPVDLDEHRAAVPTSRGPVHVELETPPSDDRVNHAGDRLNSGRTSPGQPRPDEPRPRHRTTGRDIPVCGDGSANRPPQRLVHGVARLLMRRGEHDETHGRRRAQRRSDLARKLIESTHRGEHDHDDGVTGQQMDRQFVGEPACIEARQLQPPRPPNGPQRVERGHGDQCRQPEENPRHGSCCPTPPTANPFTTRVTRIRRPRAGGLAAGSVKDEGARPVLKPGVRLRPRRREGPMAPRV